MMEILKAAYAALYLHGLIFIPIKMFMEFNERKREREREIG